MILPLDIAIYGKWIGYLIFLLIGMGFGASLELAGFGDSRRLAAQFYFKDMTVLKTMFTGIIVACLLIFLSSATGLLDFSQISVNQTFLWPGIVGGLIMGVGFVIGGYCPGTSAVSAASLKIDGILFFVGTALGAGVFGETVSLFSEFWNSSFSERLMLSDWLGWSLGATVFGVTIMALMMFYGAEKTEDYFKNRGVDYRFDWKIKNKTYIFSAIALVVAAGSVMVIGQPGPERRWDLLKERFESQLSSREAYIHPLEFIKAWNDSGLKLVTLDLRPQQEFDAFHVLGAQKIELARLKDPNFASELLQLPSQGVVVLASNDEAEATQGWKWLKAQGIKNIYILENGFGSWKETFSEVGKNIEHFDLTRPSIRLLDAFPKDSYKPKMKIETSKKAGGMCS